MGKGKTEPIYALVRRAIEILRAKHPQTLRQLFYKLVSERNPATGKAWLQNTYNQYQSLSNYMTKARNGAPKYPQLDVDEWLEDHSRIDHAPQMFTNVRNFVDRISDIYRKNCWITQPNHVEIWTEKDALINTIKDLTDELGITVRVTRGFCSTSKMLVIRKELREKQQQGKTLKLLYVGDFDPSGMEIQEDMERRIECGPVTRLGILPPKPAKRDWNGNIIEPAEIGDMARYNLLPYAPKKGDKNTPAFERKWGFKCCELDALDDKVVRQRITDAVLSVRVQELWN